MSQRTPPPHPEDLPPPRQDLFTSPPDVNPQLEDAGRMSRLGHWVIFAGLGGFLLWASMAPLDKGVSAPGTVVPADSRQVVQASQGGIIDNILISDGDEVQKGDLLLRLNTLQTRAQLDVAIRQWITVRAIQSRLISERVGRSHIEWPDDLLAYNHMRETQETMELQQALFETRRAELQSRLQVVDEEAQALREQLNGYREIRKNHELQHQSQRDEVNNMRELTQQGHLPRTRLQEAERTLAQYNSQLTSTLSDIARTQQLLNENRQKTLQIQQQFRGDVDGQLSEVSKEAGNLSDNIKSLQFELANAEIRAPAGGQVIDLKVKTEGGVVSTGQKLLEIVPIEAGWQVRVKFPPNVGDLIRVGLPVDLRFTTLKGIRPPVVTGEITMVTADLLVDEQSRENYYGATVKVSAEERKKLTDAGLNVKFGSQVEALSKTGERTLLDYLLQPITISLQGAMKEE
jgi:membrane fusion protein, protease secretion system